MGWYPGMMMHMGGFRQQGNTPTHGGVPVTSSESRITPSPTTTLPVPGATLHMGGQQANTTTHACTSNEGGTTPSPATTLPVPGATVNVERPSQEVAMEANLTDIGSHTDKDSSEDTIA